MRWVGMWSVGLVAGCIVPAPPSDYDTDTVAVDTPADTVDTTPSASGIRVLVLDDGGSGQQVEPALIAAGHTVVERKDYWRWKGVSPSPDEVDVILFLQGRTYTEAMDVEGDAALKAFYRQGGGGVIRTELAAFAATISPEIVSDADLPVIYDDGRTEGAEWLVVDRDHEIAQNISSKWDDGGSYAKVTANEGTSVVIQARDSTPLLTIEEKGRGVMIHVNHDMTGTTSTLSDNMLDLLSACVSFAGK
jgi:hypothetical protein